MAPDPLIKNVSFSVNIPRQFVYQHQYYIFTWWTRKKAARTSSFFTRRRRQSVAVVKAILTANKEESITVPLRPRSLTNYPALLQQSAPLLSTSSKIIYKSRRSQFLPVLVLLPCTRKTYLQTFHWLVLYVATSSSRCFVATPKGSLNSRFFLASFTNSVNHNMGNQYLA